MDNAQRMQMMKTHYNICSKLSNNSFWKWPILLNKMLQRPTSAELNNKP